MVEEEEEDTVHVLPALPCAMRTKEVNATVVTLAVTVMMRMVAMLHLVHPEVVLVECVTHSRKVTKHSRIVQNLVENLYNSRYLTYFVR